MAAAVAPVLTNLPTVLSVAGAVLPTFLGTAGQAQQTGQEASIYESQARQKEAVAKAERAAAQAQAVEDRRRARILQSRAQARGAAGGAIGPGLEQIEADIIAEGELSALTSLLEGEEAARRSEYGAELDRFSAKQKRRQAQTTALSGLVGGLARGFSALPGSSPANGGGEIPAYSAQRLARGLTGL